MHQSNTLLETKLCCMLIHVFCFFVIFVFTIFTQESHPGIIAPLLFSSFFFFFSKLEQLRKKYYKSCNTNRSQRGKYFNRVKSYVLFLLLSLFIIYQHLQILHHMLLVCFSRLSSSWHLHLSTSFSVHTSALLSLSFLSPVFF